LFVLDNLPGRFRYNRDDSPDDDEEEEEDDDLILTNKNDFEEEDEKNEEKESVHVEENKINKENPSSKTEFKIRINKTVQERLSLNHENRESRSTHYNNCRSRSSSYNSSDSSYIDDTYEIKRTKKLQSVIAKAIDRSSNLKCMLVSLFTFQKLFQHLTPMKTIRFKLLSFT
jgi:hypothetical protein